MTTQPFCPGSDAPVSAERATTASRATCPYCGRWQLIWTVDDNGFGVEHGIVEHRYSQAAQAEELRSAASIIRFEYARAKKLGTLNVLDNRPGASRWHVTALEMARAGRS